jgi:hypothetical protein
MCNISTNAMDLHCICSEKNAGFPYFPFIVNSHPVLTTYYLPLTTEYVYLRK